MPVSCETFAARPACSEKPELSAAFKMIEEVRRQFKEIPGIMEGTGEPDSARAAGDDNSLH